MSISIYWIFFAKGGRKAYRFEVLSAFGGEERGLWW
jgi:hypothetical protein